jgi:REP element-mobilizing transposase RayT
MSTFINCLVHCVFGTKQREPMIDDEWQERLWAYMGGIAREQDIKALSVGGTNNHVHLLVSMPATMGIAKGVQMIKAGSSLWIHQQFDAAKRFAWQEGYSAFSVSHDRAETVKRYIENQREHHRMKTFEEEYVAFLDQQGIEYKKEWVWN